MATILSLNIYNIMALSLGKQFEEKFKEDFSKLEDISIDRLYDTTAGYKSISTVCDFICYHFPNEFYIECKAYTGNTFNFAKLTQYDKLLKKSGIRGVRAGVVLWMIDHDRVFYIPVSTIKQMKDDGKKSFNINVVNDENFLYRVIEIPSKKKVKFMDSDYSVLFNLGEGD